MSHDSSDDGQQPWHRHFHPPFPERTASRPANLPSMRPPRDGFDFRRPAATSPHEEGDVIDLTNEPETPPQRTQPRASENRTSSTSRLPRFGRNILADVVDLEEEPDDDPGEGPSSSPEVQFVRATVRSQPQRRWDHLSMFQANFPRPLRARQESDTLRMRPSVSLLRERTSRLLQGFHEVDHLFLAADPPGLNGDPEEVLLDYGQSSFSMGTSNLQETRPRRDTYQAPSPAPEGFTRTLAEDDVAVCPNCSWELGTGEGKKQEIWVAKPCGHVRHQDMPDITHH